MNEKELIERCLKGEGEACDQLFLIHQSAVYRHCLSLLKDENLAKDLMQETFVHVFQHLESFQMKSKFSTWVWRIAHNLCLTYLKKHPQELTFREEIFLPQMLEKEEIDEQKLLKIKWAMSTLSPKLQEVFKMYVFDHIPQKEIAARLDIPPGTVRSRLHNARQKIRRLLIKNT